MSDEISLWVDVDTGHDDAFALLLAAHHPRARLLGVSTTYGNAPLYETTVNTLAVLRAIHCDSIKVVPGASGPLIRKAGFASSIHGESGLGGVTLLPPLHATQQVVPRSVENRNGQSQAEFLAEIAGIILGQPKNRVWLIATGPLTNVALLIQSYPQLVVHLKGLSIMGGAIGSGYTNAPLGVVQGEETPRFGNWTPYAEFNIYCDPEAASMVFGNAKLASKTTLVPLDLTHQCRGTAIVQQKLFGGTPGRSYVRRLFREVMMFFAATYAEEFNIKDGPPVHDPLAVLAALQPELFDDRSGERWNVTTILDNPLERPAASDVRLGQTVLAKAVSGSGVRVPRSLEIEAFWDSINEALVAVENRNV